MHAVKTWKHFNKPFTNSARVHCIPIAQTVIIIIPYCIDDRTDRFVPKWSKMTLQTSAESVGGLCILAVTLVVVTVCPALSTIVGAGKAV